MPGPPPKPIERKRKAGNPGHQKLPALASVITLPPAESERPPHLSEAGGALWDGATAMATGWIAPSDLPLLLMLCEAVDRRAEYLAQLANDNPVLYTDKGYAYAHPLVGMVNSLEAQITKWFSLLGFSPADRTRLGLAEVKRVSKLDALIASRQQA